MYLIATDEAGYGPKLGPLVIVATAWKLPDMWFSAADLPNLFSDLASPIQHGSQWVTIDDSKKVYRQGDGLRSLHLAVSAGLNWCGNTIATFPEVLSYLCPDDLDAIAQSPWLVASDAIPLVDQVSTQPLIDRWARSGIELMDVRARVIPARNFNQACDNGFNKADLLSHSTLGLVQDLVASIPADSKRGAVYCDRHGGRRYYAGPLQHHFSDWLLQVVAESREQSSYKLKTDRAELDVHFTVKGDRFAPVAFSSLFAKYLRERFMESINAYFANNHLGGEPLKPTAGYPLDADRFLEQVARTRQQKQIADYDFIRAR